MPSGRPRISASRFLEEKRALSYRGTIEERQIRA
jgi:hypothetical protein